ncbi:MAG: hypothetical protein QNK40_07690 [Desulfobacterales bacterium]|nr:hypothetical protein [Desulfobacterales bacterium]MDX2509065.1 hypothetical protein [Desulfobacterales bacterium]
MAFWSVREELSQANRLRRSYYELLRDELDQQLIQHALIDSYKNFRNRKVKYPFVEKRELKPRARIPDLEYECQNVFLVVFVEDTIPPENKKYIRFFDVNKTTKANLLQSKTLPLANKIDRNQKFLDSAHFSNFLKILLPVDYALLIQRNPASKARSRYSLSHFHVRIDWPIADAAEDLARSLKYISKDIFEKGDKYAEDIQKKFFEFYGLPLMVGGRRTAAIVAAQYMKRIPCISTIYTGSSESRALLRISERGPSRAVLMKFTATEMEKIAEENNMALQTFKKNYVVAREQKSGICIFQATYSPTDQSRFPDDGKLRDLKPDLSWLTIGGQHILPKPGVWKRPPIPLNVIYS